MMLNKEGCICQGCGRIYQVDLIIPDELWNQIRPKGKPPGSGMLCGACIMNRIESVSSYDWWHLSKEEKKRG